MHRLTRELTLAARITKEIYRAKLIPERKLTPLWKWGAGPEAFDSGADANLATHKGSSLGHRLVSAYPFAVNRPIRIPSDTSQVLTASDVPPKCVVVRTHPGVVRVAPDLEFHDGSRGKQLPDLPQCPRATMKRVGFVDAHGVPRMKYTELAAH